MARLLDVRRKIRAMPGFQIRVSWDLKDATMPKRRVDGDSDEGDVLADDARAEETRAAAAARADELRKLADQVEAGTAVWDRDGAGGAETEIVVVDYPPTPAAWSECEAETPAVDSRSWARACGYAALIGLLPLGLLILVFGFPWDWGTHPPRPASTQPAATIPAAALPPIPTPTTMPKPRPLQYDSRGIPIRLTDATPEELQEAFVANLDIGHIPHSPSPTITAAGGQDVCRYLDSGHHTFKDMVYWIQARHPMFNAERGDAGGFAAAAIGYYCDQYGYLIDRTNPGATS